ncbi:hypothetical protein ACFSTC_01015 [Nonomuraea ferruginea]
MVTPRVDEQVEVAGVQVLLVQQRAGGVRGQVRRFLPWRGDVPAADAAAVVDHSPGQDQPGVAGGEPVLHLRGGHRGLGQVGGHTGHPGVHGSHGGLLRKPDAWSAAPGGGAPYGRCR